MITLDFETRSECNLRRAGAWNYSLHPTTEVLCLAWLADEGVQSLSLEELSRPLSFRLIGGDTTIEAHNAGFEYAIWHNIMVPRYRWPLVPLDRWYCSAAKAAAHGLPRSLDGATSALGLSEVKDKAGHRLMMKLCKPRPHWKKHGTGDKYFGTSEEFERLEAYCRQDVRAEHALSSALAELNPTERKIWMLDNQINRRGINCDLPMVSAAIDLAATESEIGKAEIVRLTDGEIQTPNQVAKIRAYVEEVYLYDLPGLGAQLVQDALNDPELPKGAAELLRLRQRHSKSSVKKYLAKLDRSNAKGVIMDILLYHGAHTGRWAGRGIQPQNYPRPSLSREEIETLVIPAILERDVDTLELYCGSIGEALSMSLRSALVAPPGHDLIGADYASIEARVLLWLAGDNEALETLRNGGDLYVEMAALIYSVPQSEVTKDQRGIGKRAILGLGYQMGAPRFKSSAAEQGVTVSTKLAKRAVKTYRSQFTSVTGLWESVNSTALSAMRTGKAALPQDQRVVFLVEKPFVFVDLPSGRRLAYCDPKLKMNRFGRVALSHMHVDPDTKKWKRTTTYGGKLTENLCQAIARDLMVEAMLRVEDRGYRTRMTVHDELVATIPEGKGSVAEFEQSLCEPPSWADGCPIAAEGWRGKRYRK